MQSIPFYINGVLWHLKRPRLHRQLLRRISAACTPTANTRAESVRWCANRAVSAAELLERMTGSSTAPAVTEAYRPTFTAADTRARACPFKMGGPGDVNLLYQLCEHLQARRVVETGVAYGWSSLAILLSISQRRGARLLSTDMPYMNVNNDDYVGCVVPERLRSNWQLIKRADREGLPKALAEFDAIDLSHYDSDKRYPGRMWAYPKLWQKLRPGGYFISDDIGDNVGFRDFCEQIEREPMIVACPVGTGVKYIGVIVKDA